MIDVIIEFIKEINIGQLISMAAMFWIFNSRLDKKFEKIDQRFEKVEQRFEKIETKIEDIDRRLCRLETKIEDIDRRLCRIEGSLSTHGHCLFNQSHAEKKAE
jgi:septal ring factor EnvC (AmiA/AmiB activator)